MRQILGSNNGLSQCVCNDRQSVHFGIRVLIAILLSLVAAGCVVGSGSGSETEFGSELVLPLAPMMLRS